MDHIKIYEESTTVFSGKYIIIKDSLSHCNRYWLDIIEPHINDDEMVKIKWRRPPYNMQTERIDLYYKYNGYLTQWHESLSNKCSGLEEEIDSPIESIDSTTTTPIQSPIQSPLRHHPNASSKQDINNTASPYKCIAPPHSPIYSSMETPKASPTIKPNKKVMIQKALILETKEQCDENALIRDNNIYKTSNKNTKNDIKPKQKKRANTLDLFNWIAKHKPLKFNKSRNVYTLDHTYSTKWESQFTPKWTTTKDKLSVCSKKYINDQQKFVEWQQAPSLYHWLSSDPIIKESHLKIFNGKGVGAPIGNKNNRHCKGKK